MWFRVDFTSPLSNSLRESCNLCYSFHWVCCKVMSSIHTVFTKGTDLKHTKKAWLLILNRWLCSKGRDAPNPLWLRPYVPSSAQLSTLIRHICFPMNLHSPTETHGDRIHARPYGKSTTGESLKWPHPPLWLTAVEHSNILQCDQSAGGQDEVPTAHRCERGQKNGTDDHHGSEKPVYESCSWNKTRHVWLLRSSCLTPLYIFTVGAKRW